MSRTGNLLVAYVEDSDPITVRQTNVDINGHIYITGTSDALERLAAAITEFVAMQRAKAGVPPESEPE